MNTSIQQFSFIAAIVLVLVSFTQSANATITTSGDVFPATDPGTWTMSNYCIIGYHSDGAVAIDGGSDVTVYEAYLGQDAGTTGTVSIDGIGSTWTMDQSYVGTYGNGILNITNGGSASCSGNTSIGYVVGSTGIATVDGSGSTWTTTGSYFFVGQQNNTEGTLNITDGGVVNNTRITYIGYEFGSRGKITVDGAGSSLITGETIYSEKHLYVGVDGSGTLEITNGGLVSAVGPFIIDSNGGNDSFVDMATGGMLALKGDADDSLTNFLTLVSGSDAIRYWNGTGWDTLTNATYGDDYTINYQTEGARAGYTVLRVTAVPEPLSMLLLLAGLPVIRGRK